jgi:hypothetical protein
MDASSRAAVLAAVDVLCLPETIEHYRQRRRLTNRETATMLGGAIGRLFEPAT